MFFIFYDFYFKRLSLKFEVPVVDIHLENTSVNSKLITVKSSNKAQIFSRWYIFIMEYMKTVTFHFHQYLELLPIYKFEKICP